MIWSGNPISLLVSILPTLHTEWSRVSKGARWMPWRREPKKDVVGCDKPRGAAYRLRSGDLRMGQPTRGHARVPLPEYIGQRGVSGGTETSKYPEEKRLFP